jgi:hypothetical protein
MATIQQVYLALLARPADPGGLAFWQGITGNGANLAPMLAAIVPLPEYQQRFAGQTPDVLVNSIYRSLFDRDADQAGLAFFVGELNSGRQTLATIAVNVLDGARGTDAQIILDKTVAADRHTASLAPAPQASGKGYGFLEFSAGAPGSGDIDLAPMGPQFVDSARNIQTWDRALGGDGSVGGAIARIDAGAQGYSVSGLMAYVREGYTPRNPALDNTGFGGADIGAVPFDGAASPVSPATASAARIVTKAGSSGLWSDPGTWIGGVVPRPGDIVELTADTFVDTDVSGMLIVKRNATATILSVTYGHALRDNYYVIDTDQENPHFLQTSRGMAGATKTAITGNIFHYTGRDHQGDVLDINQGNPGASGKADTTILLTHNIVLPNSAGEHSGVLVSVLDGNYGEMPFQVFIENNTALIGREGAAVVGESQADFAGQYASFRNNLLWDTVARGYKLWDIGADELKPDVIGAAAISNNAGWNYL